MKIMTRYVLSELLQTFLVTLLGMTLFMIIVGVMREAYTQGLGMKQVALLLPYVLPRRSGFRFLAQCCLQPALFMGGWVLITKSSHSKRRGSRPGRFSGRCLRSVQC